MVPNMGVSRSGVRKATPGVPKCVHTCTMRRFFLVKTGFCLARWRLEYQAETAWPITEKTTTLVIIPATVSSTVSKYDKPRDTPVKGPPINFTILIRYTERYFNRFTNTF